VRSGAGRKSGGAERSSERALQKNDGADRGAGGRGAMVVVRPSVCRLSVMLVHPNQAMEIFGNLSTPFGTLATH